MGGALSRKQYSEHRSASPRINDLWTFLYRLALYSVIYGTLLTLRGPFPKRSPEKKMSADTVPNA